MPAVNERRTLVAELRAGFKTRFCVPVWRFIKSRLTSVWHVVENQSRRLGYSAGRFLWKVFKGIKGFNGDSSLRT